MRLSKLLGVAAATLVGVSVFTICASGPASAQDACGRIRSACLAAGFRQGAANSGRGLQFDCIDPILQHRGAPARSMLRLPRIDRQVVAACLHPGAAHAPHTAARVTPATPAAQTSPPAASPANATAPANAIAPANATAPTNATALTNSTSPTNATAPTNAAATNAAAPAAPAPGPSPLVIIAALLVLGAVVGAAIFLARRPRKAAPRPGPAAAAPAASAAPAPAVVPVPIPAPGAEAPPAPAPAALASVPPPVAAPGAPRTHDVFISYSSKDKPIADAVCAILEREGVRCWITPRDVRPGDEWAGAIIRAISGARVVVLIFSTSSNTSPQVLREIERAVHGGAAIIPFRIEDTPPSASLEYFISTPHWLDAITPPLEAHAVRLAESVKSLLGQPPAP